MKTCPLCLKRLSEGAHGTCLEKLWTTVQRMSVLPRSEADPTPRFSLLEDESPEEWRMRLESLALYAHELRRDHRDDDGIGEICDQIELRAWGPRVS